MEHGHIWIVWILIGIAVGWLAKDRGFGPSADIITAVAGTLTAASSPPTSASAERAASVRR